MATDPKRALKLITKNHQFCLFFILQAHFSLLGKPDKELHIKNLSKQFAEKLCQNSEHLSLKPILEKIMEDNLNEDPTKFTEWLKEFAKNIAKIHMISVTEALIMIYDQLSRTNNQTNPKHNNFLEVLLKTKQKTAAETFSYIHGKYTIPKVPAHIQKIIDSSTEWKDLFAWANAEDTTDIFHKSLEQPLKSHFKAILKYGVPVILATPMLGYIGETLFTDTEGFTNFLNSSLNLDLGTEDVSASIDAAKSAIAPVFFLVSAYFYFRQRDSLNEKLIEESQKETPKLLNKLLNIKISVQKNPSANKQEASNAPQDEYQLSISLPKPESSKNPLFRKEKKPFQEKIVLGVKKDANSNNSSYSLIQNHFSRDERGLTRVMMRGKVKETFVLPNGILEKYQDKKLEKKAYQAFKWTDFGETGTCFRKLKSQPSGRAIELKIVGSEDHVYFKQIAENTYEATEVAKAMHLKNN